MRQAEQRFKFVSDEQTGLAHTDFSFDLHSAATVGTMIVVRSEIASTWRYDSANDAIFYFFVQLRGMSPKDGGEQAVATAGRNGFGFQTGHHQTRTAVAMTVPLLFLGGAGVSRWHENGPSRSESCNHQHSRLAHKQRRPIQPLSILEVRHGHQQGRKHRSCWLLLLLRPKT